jgi:hypothetical protein
MQHVHIGKRIVLTSGDVRTPQHGSDTEPVSSEGLCVPGQVPREVK